MKSLRHFYMLAVYLFSASIIFSCRNLEKSLDHAEPVDLVNLNIGAISHLLVPTYPTTHIPNSMIRLYPYTTPGVNDHYLASRIFGFPVNIPSHRSNPLTTIMAGKGGISLDPDSLASAYDHDFVTATPYFYSVFLEDPEIWAEYTVTRHGAIYSFRTENSGVVRIVIRSTNNGIYRADSLGVITGYDHLRKVTQYLYAETEPAPGSIAAFTGEIFRIVEEPVESKGSGVVLSFELPENGVVTLRLAISFISQDQARQNASDEVLTKSFEEVKIQARDSWENALGKISITGGTSDQRQVFYTALYRCYERMINITEDGRYYSAYDNQVHDAGKKDFYVDDWSWDTFRSLHPLRTILDPDLEAEMINSYVRAYEQSGWMPSFPTLSGDMGAMIGHHQAAIITDAWQKGIREFDIESAYNGLRKNAMEGTRVPWKEGPMTEIDKVYLEKGFFPARLPGTPETDTTVHSFEGRQSVAVTLEHTYDDWCLSRLAAALGKNDDSAIFYSRGQNYWKSFDRTNGFMSPRSADGNWIEPFNPKAPAGIGGREYFAECNSWTYTWFVPHDIPGLAGLLGGTESAIERLDQLFDEPLDQSKWTYLGYMPDATGLTGVFTMGNEPAFHIPYLYSLLGTPWKTQKRVRQLMESWFRNDLMGVCGDDDGGAMSAWYVFSALGFYPVCPGNPKYVLGSPLFEKTVITLPQNRTFTIKATGVSSQNKYIQSASLNGEPLDTPWLTHTQITRGGEVEFRMGARPNKNWGNKINIDEFMK